MTDDQFDIRSALERVADNAPRPQGLRRATVRRGIGGRIGFITLPLVLVASIAWVAIASPFSDDRRSGMSAGPSTGQDCPVSRGQSDQTEWTSPTTFIASGTFDGQDWVLCARTVHKVETSDEGLCMNWRLGDGLGTGMNCAFSYHQDQAVALDEAYFSPVMGPEEGYLYGAIPAASATVELKKADGSIVPGTIYRAPEELGVQFSFFTIFDEPYAEGELIAKNQSGEILVQRQMRHGLAQLSVTVTGDGEGIVKAYRTEELRYYEECRREKRADCRQPRQAWIKCPQECSAGLAGADVTLVARPEEGSTFEGWSGDCSGKARCVLVVNQEREVEASFSPSG